MNEVGFTMNKPLYRISFILEYLRHTYEVYAYDFDVTYNNCLTMYFKNGGRIVVDAGRIEDLDIELIR